MQAWAFGELDEYGIPISKLLIVIQIMISLISHDDLGYMVLCAWYLQSGTIKIQIHKEEVILTTLLAVTE
jgi:hypothetical protein